MNTRIRSYGSALPYQVLRLLRKGFAGNARTALSPPLALAICASEKGGSPTNANFSSVRNGGSRALGMPS